MVLEQLDIHMQKIWNRPYTLHINWLKVSNRPKCKIEYFIKHLEDNIGEYLYDLWYGNDFLDATPKVWSMKEKLAEV